MADIGVKRTGDAAVIEQTGFRLSWGAIFAGLVVATGLHLALALLGVAIGLSAWNPADPFRTVGADDVAMGVGIWTAISGIIALFIGGMTTGRLAGVLTRGDGALHGVVMWALTMITIMWLIVSGVGFLLGGAFGIIGRTAGAAVGAVGQVAGAAGPDVAQMGLPAVMRGEERETMVTELTARTGLSRAEAEQIVSDAETRAQATRRQVATTADTLQARAPGVAQDVTDSTARAAWWALLAMGLSVAAAAGGAASTARE
ncbi:hypothetical protein BH24GEM3_BH24GEM3_08930 [soil metagenome]|jgi:hypothetical protein|nr:hypothetical protein [Gemmatimonadota bacterium]